MKILRILQTNFVRNKKLIKTQNSPRKLLKLVQIPTKTSKKSLKLEIVNVIVYNSIPLCGHQMLRVFSIPLNYKIFFSMFLILICRNH
jgi:hypothetical protein